jgi:hypothetical protein
MQGESVYSLSSLFQWSDSSQRRKNRPRRKAHPGNRLPLPRQHGAAGKASDTVSFYSTASRRVLTSGGRPFYTFAAYVEKAIANLEQVLAGKRVLPYIWGGGYCAVMKWLALKWRRGEMYIYDVMRHCLNVNYRIYSMKGRKNEKRLY